jgi:hypothetical protein
MSGREYRVNNAPYVFFVNLNLYNYLYQKIEIASPQRTAKPNTA